MAGQKKYQVEREYGKPLLTQIQYAVRKGVNPSYVSKLLKEGKLECVQGTKFMDPELCDELWEANDIGIRLERKKMMEEGAAAKKESRKAKAAGKHVPKELDGLTLTQANLKKVYWDGLKRETEVMKLNGELVEKELVSKELFKYSRDIRNAIMGLPAMVMDQLASMEDAFEIKIYLEEEIRKKLEGISDELELSGSGKNRKGRPLGGIKA